MNTILRRTVFGSGPLVTSLVAGNIYMASYASSGSPINRFCPRSGKPIAQDSITEYRGVNVAFCNPHCRDDFASPQDPPSINRRAKDQIYFDALIKELDISGATPKK